MKILVIDDEENQRNILSDILTDAGYQVTTAANGEKGLQFIYRDEFFLVLTDLKMPGKDGIEVLKEVLSFDPNIQVILMTAFGSIPSAVHAIKAGAYDYLTKPFQKDELLRVISRAVDKVALIMENRQLKNQVVEKYGFLNLVGTSTAMKKIFRLIERIKDIDATILITGESGTGKEVFAKAVHYNGIRRSGPFIAVNCGAIPENLIESELFGYQKGAFTGATRNYAGKFEQAQKGTIFLDEIGAMPHHLQVRLLRVLQEKQISKLGSETSIDLDMRIIAATNENLQKKIENGQFRVDLFHRLDIFSIHIPPLRERPEDIPLLVKHFIEKFSKIYNKNVFTLSSDALKKLENYRFPGNIRELENIIEKTFILNDKDIIGAEHLLLGNSKDNEQTDQEFSQANLSQMEQDLIRHALKANMGSIKKSSEALGISYKTLQYRIKKYGLNKNNFKTGNL
jgi:DNA-binding NtrC family response regulator